jgi:hypothetical protein
MMAVIRILLSGAFLFYETILGSLVGDGARWDLDKNHLNPKPEFRYLLFGAFHI